MLEKTYINDSESDGYSEDYTHFDKEFKSKNCCYWYYLCCGLQSLQS